jgi:DNA-binding transcriptional LysR family regulator
VLARLRRAHPQIEIELVASNELTNLLRREADIAVRMVRPAQQSLIAKKLGEIEIVAAAHEAYLAKAPPLNRPEDLRAHCLIGFDRDDAILRGFARAGLALTRADFALRTDDQVVYGRLVAEGAGIGFVARYNLRCWPGVVRLLPEFVVPPLPCWLAVHREIRSNALVRIVYDFLARELSAALAR